MTQGYNTLNGSNVLMMMINSHMCTLKSLHFLRKLADFCTVYAEKKNIQHFVHCHILGTCCEGYVCQYGHCTKGVKQGEPGTYCDKTSDCLGKESCCVREISVNSHTSICKPMLNEFESCGPINLFHHIYNGGMVEPDCGPCKNGLQCKNVG